MNIPDEIRRSVSDLAGKAAEKGRQIGKEAQLQMQIKKLQVEHAKKIHELGKRAYGWHRSGTMIVSGPVPRDVLETCLSLDDTQRSMNATQRELEEAREEARRAFLNTTVQPSTPAALPAPDDGK